MTPSMPSMAALRAFHAFVEEGSVVRAGRALNVSHAAISQQLRALERHLGIALFDRSGRGLSLTDDGHRLARGLQQGFGAIATAVDELVGKDAQRPVHVSLTPSFAAAWMMPRLSGFRDQHPEIDLILDPSPDLVDLSPGGVDIALRYGRGQWRGLSATLLLQSPMVVVASPELLSGRRALSAAELADMPWLIELGTNEATNWLAQKGQSFGGAGQIAMPGNLVLDGVRAGQGVTVTVRHFVERDIENGTLVELYCEPAGAGYHVVTRPEPLRPAARQFERWLLRQIVR